MLILRVVLLLCGAAILAGDAWLLRHMWVTARAGGQSVFSALMANLLTLAVFGGGGAGVIALGLGFGLPAQGN